MSSCACRVCVSWAMGRNAEWFTGHLRLSVFRAAADAKLGAPRHRTVITPLPQVHENGGNVSRTLVLLQRLYPIFFWRRDLSGATTVLTPRAHDRSLRTAESNAARVGPSACFHTRLHVQGGSRSSRRPVRAKSESLAKSSRPCFRLQRQWTPSCKRRKCSGARHS